MTDFEKTYANGVKVLVWRLTFSRARISVINAHQPMCLDDSW